MDYGKAFTFPQQDPDWLKKWGIAGALSLIPIVGGLITAGYGVEVTRRVIQNDPQPLPEWNDFGGFLRKGFGVLVIALVHMLPLILLVTCAVVPVVVLSSASDSGNGDMIATMASLVSACVGCLATLYALIAGLMLQPAIARYAVTDQISAGLRFGENFAMLRGQPAMFLIVWLLSGLAASVLSSLGSIACGIGAFWGAAYATLVSGHLLGQAYREASASGTVQ